MILEQLAPVSIAIPAPAPRTEEGPELAPFRPASSPDQEELAPDLRGRVRSMQHWIDLNA